MKTFVYIFCILVGSNVVSQNYCLRFFGNGTNDIDRVKIPLDNPHRSIDVGLSFTIEFQLKANLSDNPLGSSATQGSNDDWTLGHIIIDRDIFGNGDYGDYGISLVNGRVAFGVNNGNESFTIISNNQVTDGTWHHIAVTRNHVTGQLSIFIDGVLDKSVTTSVTGDISYRDGRQTNWPNDPFLVIGAEKHDYDNTTYPSFNGMIDELRFSDIVRYSSNYTPLLRFECDSHTVALYHFDEGQGTTVYEHCNQATNLLNGTIHYGGNPAGPVWLINDLPSFYAPIEHNAILFYPNPATHSIEIFKENNSPIEIFDELGRIRIRSYENRIDISYLSSGFYFIKIGNKHYKFIKT